jgi:hypothetical protein
MRQHPEYNGELIIKGTWEFELVEEIHPFSAGDRYQQGPLQWICWDQSRHHAASATYHQFAYCGRRLPPRILCHDGRRCHFPVRPPAMMDATIFNVEKFFGWVRRLMRSAVRCGLARRAHLQNDRLWNVAPHLLAEKNRAAGQV